MGVASHFYSPCMCIIANIWGKSPENVFADWPLLLEESIFVKPAILLVRHHIASAAQFPVRHFLTLYLDVSPYWAGIMALAFLYILWWQELSECILVSLFNLFISDEYSFGTRCPALNQSHWVLTRLLALWVIKRSDFVFLLISISSHMNRSGGDLVLLLVYSCQFVFVKLKGVC